MIIYKGTLNWVNGPGLKGRIDTATITYLDGTPVSESRQKEITVNLEASGSYTLKRLQVGMELAFEIHETAPDAALYPRHLKDAPQYNGVHISFVDKEIDNPTVQIGWQLTPSVVEWMREHPRHLWSLVLIAQEKPKDIGNDVTFNTKKTVLQTINGLEDICRGVGFFAFMGAGEYDFAAYLVRSNDYDSFLFWNTLKSFRRNAKYIDLWHDTRHLITSKPQNFGSIVSVTAFSHISVHVPDGIFAKPLSPWQKSWLSYFRLDNSKDECQDRGRLFLACTIGIPLFLLWEGLKRLWLLVVGSGHFFFGGNPLQFWKEAFAPRLSAYGRLTGRDDFEELSFFKDWKAIFCPYFLIICGVLLSSILSWKSPDPSILSHLVWVFEYAAFILICIAAVISIVFGVVFLSTKLEKRKKRLALSSLGTYSAFNPSSDAIASAPEARSIRLLYRKVKRKFCRTRGQ